MSIWADGVFDKCSEFELLEDYAICYSSDNTMFEISVLKAKSEDDAEKIVEVFERRKQTLKGGEKAAYDPDFNNLMNNSEILKMGEYVALLITSENASAIKAIENLQ